MIDPRDFFTFVRRKGRKFTYGGEKKKKYNCAADCFICLHIRKEKGKGKREEMASGDLPADHKEKVCREGVHSRTSRSCAGRTREKRKSRVSIIGLSLSDQKKKKSLNPHARCRLLGLKRGKKERERPALYFPSGPGPERKPVVGRRASPLPAKKEEKKGVAGDPPKKGYFGVRQNCNLNLFSGAGVRGGVGAWRHAPPVAGGGGEKGLLSLRLRPAGCPATRESSRSRRSPSAEKKERLSPADVASKGRRPPKRGGKAQ